MGHLTSGGTTANIEAIWAARNVKYFPLGLQEALLKEDRLSKARGYKVTKGKKEQRGKNGDDDVKDDYDDHNVVLFVISNLEICLSL